MFVYTRTIFHLIQLIDNCLCVQQLITEILTELCVVMVVPLSGSDIEEGDQLWLSTHHWQSCVLWWQQVKSRRRITDVLSFCCNTVTLWSQLGSSLAWLMSCCNVSAQLTLHSTVYRLFMSGWDQLRCLVAAPPYLASRTTPQHRGNNSVTIYSNMRQIHGTLYIVYRRRLSILN